MDPSYLITVFVTLFVIMDPPGLVPAFVAVTQGLSSNQRRKIALRACLVAIGVLTVFAAFGESVLEFIGISMHAFRVSGGVLLFLTALDMLFERRTQRRENRADGDDHHDPSVFPLAIPLIAGPGAIASIILLVGQQPGWIGFTSVVGLMIVVVSMVFFMFLISGLFERLLGKTGIIVVTRLFGMLLAALAVQFVLDGLKGFGFAG